MTITKWAIDPNHSELNFKIRHLMITNVSGAFKKFDVVLETEGDNFNKAKIKATAEMNSVTTNNEQRDHHLLTSDFFEVEKYPTLEFNSTKIEKIDNETFNLYGDLTIKGVTKPVELTVEQSETIKDPWGQTKTGFSVTGKINRSEWGINFNSVMETGGLGLGEEVKISSELQMIKQTESVPA